MRNFKFFLMLFLFSISLNSATAEYRVVSKSTPTRLTQKIIIPKAASGLKLKEIDIVGDELVLGAKVAGILKIRATARYGWFGDFEGPPELELEISKLERKKLPHAIDWNPGYFSSFTISNADQVINKLFDENTIDRVNDKKLATAEQEVYLEISELNFGSDCGMHFRAVIKSAKRVPNSNLIVKNEGLNFHC